MLNADEKTVAQLLTESADDGTSQLQVQPLRGYDVDGDRIARLVGGVDGLTAATTTPYDDALALATRSPIDREQDVMVQLRPETPAPVAIASMLAQFAAVINNNVAGTIAAIDTEFLHDLRVAVRRTRSTRLWCVKVVLDLGLGSTWSTLSGRRIKSATLGLLFARINYLHRNPNRVAEFTWQLPCFTMRQASWAEWVPRIIERFSNAGNNRIGFNPTKEGTPFPAGLHMESASYSPGWRSVTGLDGYAIDRKTHDADGPFSSWPAKATYRVGRHGQETVRKAIEPNWLG